MSGDRRVTQPTPASHWGNYSKESEQERQKRYKELFSKLDVNKDGTICIADLTQALSAMGLGNQSQTAQVI